MSAPPEPVRAVILDLDANDELDITSAEQLDKLIDALRKRDISIGIAHMHGPAVDMARRTGVLDKIGTARVFPTVAAAVAWARSADGPSPPEPA